MKSKWLILLFICILLSCKKKNSLMSSDSESIGNDWFEVKENAVATDEVVINPAQFQWLTYKTRLSYHSEIASFENANLVMRIQKDSVIWFSATHLGFEVVRGMFEKDSVRLLNRFQKEYITADYNQLSNKLGFWLTYPRIQALLTGDLMFDAEANKKWFNKNDSIDYFIGNEVFLKVNTEVQRDIGRVVQTIVADPRSNNLLKVTNNSFNKIGSSLYPMHTLIEIYKNDIPSETDRKNMSVEVNHQHIDTLGNTPGFPFSIPTNYKRIVL